MYICGKTNVFVLVAAISISISFLLQLFAVAMPYWVEIDQAGTKPLYKGLFELCISITNHEHVCRTYSAVGMTTESWWDTNVALQVIGLICIHVSLVLGFCALICCKRRPLIYLLAAGFAIIAGLFIMIGLIVFGAANDRGAEDFHACFYLALFALAFGLVAGIFFAVAKHVQFD